MSDELNNSKLKEENDENQSTISKQKQKEKKEKEIKIVKKYKKKEYKELPPTFINKKLRIFDIAPQFKATAYLDNSFFEISLEDYKNKWLILFFYPLDYTFVCPTEINALNEIYDEFKQHECEVLAVSVDSEFSHKYFALKPKHKGGIHPCNIALLSDFNKNISLEYGVLYDEGINEGFSKRATFIIDDKGIIRDIDVNDNEVGRNVDDILRRFKQLKGVVIED